MEYVIEKEELNLVFEVKDEITEEDIKKRGLEIVGKRLVLGIIKKEAECFTYVANMQPIAKTDDNAGFLLGRQFFMKMEDEDEAYEFINSLFTPNFKTESYGLGQIQFYTDVNERTYSVSIDYDFKDEMRVIISKFLDDIALSQKYLKDFQIIFSNIFGEGDE